MKYSYAYVFLVNYVIKDFVLQLLLYYLSVSLTQHFAPKLTTRQFRLCIFGLFTCPRWHVNFSLNIKYNYPIFRLRFDNRSDCWWFGFKLVSNNFHCEGGEWQCSHHRLKLKNFAVLSCSLVLLVFHEFYPRCST